MTYELLYAVINVIVNNIWPIPRQMTLPQKDAPQYPSHGHRLVQLHTTTKAINPTISHNKRLSE